MNELNKYKLERKNTYLNYTIVGLKYLCSAATLSGISASLEGIEDEKILYMLSNEVNIVAFIVVAVSYIKTFPLTKKIVKLKVKKYGKKIN